MAPTYPFVPQRYRALLTTMSRLHVMTDVEAENEAFDVALNLLRSYFPADERKLTRLPPIVMKHQMCVTASTVDIPRPLPDTE